MSKEKSVCMAGRGSRAARRRSAAARGAGQAPNRLRDQRVHEGQPPHQHHHLRTKQGEGPRAGQEWRRHPGWHGGASAQHAHAPTTNSNQLRPARRTTMIARKAAALVCGFCSSAAMLRPSASPPSPPPPAVAVRLSGCPACLPLATPTALAPLAGAAALAAGAALLAGTPPYCRSSMRMSVRYALDMPCRSV